jgi:hypothetical protein
MENFNTFILELSGVKNLCESIVKISEQPERGRLLRTGCAVQSKKL